MTSMRDVLKDKGSQVHSIQQDKTVFEAIKQMSESNVGALLVMDGDGICGIVTERDYLRRVILKDKLSKETPVSDIMSTDVCCARIEDSVETCLAVMTKQHCRHLPIVSDDGLAGLVSIGDLVKQVVQDREAEIRHLTDYIQGRYPG